MRINDKHLCRIATGNTPVDKEGYLQKRGEVNKSFQKRWFVLKGNLLFYFDKPYDKEPTGVIVIENCTVELADSTGAYTFELVFTGSSSRTYILAGETQEEMEGWMKAITCASYDYMKLMVNELQRRVDELNDEQAKAEAQQMSRVTRNVDQRTDVLVNFMDNEPSTSSFDPLKSSMTSSPFSFPSRSNDERSFEQLHEEYGRFIRAKMLEVQTM